MWQLKYPADTEELLKRVDNLEKEGFLPVLKRDAMDCTQCSPGRVSRQSLQSHVCRAHGAGTALPWGDNWQLQYGSEWKPTAADAGMREWNLLQTPSQLCSVSYTISAQWNSAKIVLGAFLSEVSNLNQPCLGKVKNKSRFPIAKYPKL